MCLSTVVYSLCTRSRTWPDICTLKSLRANGQESLDPKNHPYASPLISLVLFSNMRTILMLVISKDENIFCHKCHYFLSHEQKYKTSHIRREVNIFTFDTFNVAYIMKTFRVEAHARRIQ